MSANLRESWKIAAYLQIPPAVAVVVLICLYGPRVPWMLFSLTALLVLLWVSAAVYAVAFSWSLPGEHNPRAIPARYRWPGEKDETGTDLLNEEAPVLIAVSERGTAGSGAGEASQ